MGPLIPNGIIPIEWNFIIAILIGIAFGYILEATGFSSSRKLAGVFYGYDFVVLKVFFTAAVVSAIGLYYMDYMNLVDIGELYIQPLYLYSAIAGGMIMGIGFIAGGFCPGTSLCAVAIGKIDGMAFNVGLVLGIFIFSESFGLLEPFFEATNLGHITMDNSLGISAYWIILAVTVIAVTAFAFSDWVKTKVKSVFY